MYSELHREDPFHGINDKFLTTKSLIAGQTNAPVDYNSSSPRAHRNFLQPTKNFARIQTRGSVDSTEWLSSIPVRVSQLRSIRQAGQVLPLVTANPSFLARSAAKFIYTHTHLSPPSLINRLPLPQ